MINAGNHLGFKLFHNVLFNNRRICVQKTPYDLPSIATHVFYLQRNNSIKQKDCCLSERMTF